MRRTYVSGYTPPTEKEDLMAKWIQKATENKGGLHESLGVPKRVTLPIGAVPSNAGVPAYLRALARVQRKALAPVSPGSHELGSGQEGRGKEEFTREPPHDMTGIPGFPRQHGSKNHPRIR